MTRDESHTKLVEQAITMGLPLFDGESDVELRRRLHMAIARTPDNRFTLTSVDAHVTEFIGDIKPAFVEDKNIKRALAIYWLQAERPTGFWARLSWVWKTAKLLWKL